MIKKSRMTPFASGFSLLLITALTLFGENYVLVDSSATAETKRLVHQLRELAPDHLLFGHQNTNIYGVEWTDKKEHSDVYGVTGKFPSVYGYDFYDITSGLAGGGRTDAAFEDYVKWSKWIVEKGSIITFSWHQKNLLTKGSFYDKTPSVYSILPGGEQHELFCQQLDLIAGYFAAVAPYPVIFRPYHEHNGDWFWWGKPFCTEEEYIQLWRFVVSYIRDTKNIHNVLWSFSPDRSRLNLDNGKKEYFYGYPGDEYVDILGLDNYWDLGHPANDKSLEVNQKNFVKSLELLNEIAQEKGKLCALTETGIEAQVDHSWWTKRLLAGIYANEKTSGISWVLVWRNANRLVEKKEHFYAPYPGHPIAEDFKCFETDGRTLFEGDFANPYQ